MQILCRAFPYILLYNLFLNTICAQDSNSAQLSASRAIAFYNKFIGEEAHLYNGSEHAPFDFRVKGNPYFESALLQAGFVNYDGILYQPVNMAYDIVRDEVTANRYNQNFRIALVSEKIAYFSLFNHYFIRIVPDTNNKLISAGFYDLIYDGKIKLFTKREKKIKESVTPEEGDQFWFEENDRYFIFKNNKYYSIKDKKDLFDFFRDRKKELKKYLRKNKIKFKNEPELAILKSVEYYDQLKN